MTKIAFIGAGELAESLVKGILAKPFCPPQSIWMTNHSNKDKLTYLSKTYQVNATPDKTDVLRQADAVFLAFRPGNARDALAEIKDQLTNEQLVISLMVGVPSAYIEEIAGKSLQIVRAMPNTSASNGLSATGMAANANVSDDNLALAQRLFEAVGTVTVVAEQEIDIIAGLAGSGPAYLYYLAEAMEEAGIREGLSSEASAALVQQTIKGAAHLLNHSGKSARQLLKAVATPGGTTQAGLDTLDQHETKDAIIACVHQAIRRAGEMSQPFKH
ncbi:pyrroline-5-carboxylate reductase [Sporolactobacillus spathodeae]|uniref:Pyrroline-5-carboxylate reductase n=1 Tax=Sporolactobacillus spathodeae TaxID=1465502 RepID=A0ABS2Q6V0_9BACL|nr:pyrroline-5-carboxylate reductase [Sporolactobacillus spathodeae]MBM7657490.1 pyrroline-5-carboxylate reductase [Sporolactobacillus spathodeae]